LIQSNPIFPAKVFHDGQEETLHRSYASIWPQSALTPIIWRDPSKGPIITPMAAILIAKSLHFYAGLLRTSKRSSHGSYPILSGPSNTPESMSVGHYRPTRDGSWRTEKRELTTVSVRSIMIPLAHSFDASA